MSTLRPFHPAARPVRSTLAWPAALAAALLSGCSVLPVTVADGQLVARAIWHTGTVARTVADDALPVRLRPTCGAGTTADTARRWAIIDYRQDRLLRRTAVPLDSGQALTDGTTVLVRAQGCERAWAPQRPTLAASAATAPQP